VIIPQRKGIVFPASVFPSMEAEDKQALPVLYSVFVV
jgi:hypothetical protein